MSDLDKPRIAFTATFEFETRPPMTHRGTVVGGGPGTCMRRAMDQARRALEPIAWTSCVCVLERPAPRLNTRDVVMAPSGAVTTLRNPN